MASVLAIISKKVFENLAPGVHPGDVIEQDTWWLGTEVRAFLATFPADRLVLHGAYAPLRALAGKPSSHAE